ncbi:MAG: GvpL/GvpF family gas vesicle protein [Cyanobacteria bacterium P01_H01_bin.58]
MLYVYAFCPQPATPLTLPAGITHATVQIITGEKLAAIAEPDIDVAQIKDDDQQLMGAILAHDHVLVQLFDQTALLPLRFGTQFQDTASLETYLRTHQDTHLQTLAALADRAEYLVKLMPQAYNPTPVNEPSKGREYFLAKKKRLQAQTQFQAQQTSELQQFVGHLEAIPMQYLEGSPQEEQVRFHILAERDATSIQSHLEIWQQQLPSWEISLSDPLPPYHFAQ